MKNKKVNIYDCKINKSLLDDRTIFTNMRSHTDVTNNKTIHSKILHFYINNVTNDHFVVIKKLLFNNKTIILIDIMRYTNFEFYKQSNILLSLDDPKIRKAYKKILRKFKRYNCNILPYKIKINKNFVRGLTNDYL